MKFTIGNGSVLVQNGAGKTIDYIDSSGELHSITLGVTQQSVIKNFMNYLDNYPTLAKSREDALLALDLAANYASNNTFATWDALIESFISDVQTYGIKENSSNADFTYDGVDEYGQPINVVPESGLDNFLKNYCGINLVNEDTGAITGADAGGAETKTPASIVPENGTVADLLSPSTGSTTINGLTFNWPTAGNDANKQYILDSLNTWWAEEGLNLIEESYGLSFTEDGVTGNNINVEFVNEDKNYMAQVETSYTYHYSIQGSERILTSIDADLTLQINMKHFENVDVSDVSGYAGSPSGYLDRTIAHELTHAVMSATMENVYSNLPLYFKEGVAELVHGIDDFRTINIISLARSTNTAFLSQVLQPNVNAGASSYAGGYMLLRYFAKQVADSFGATISDTSRMLAGSVTDSVVSAASMLWTDDTVATVADTGSQLTSSMTAVTNAMLTPLDSTDSNLYGSDSLSSGLFSDTNKNQSFLG